MLKKTLSVLVVACFVLTTLGPLPQAHADNVVELPAPGTMVNLSPAYQPVIIRGLTVHKDNPFLFDFIVDVGQDKMSGAPLKKEGEKLIKYFLASLAIPDKDVWVNLSPYEKDRMIPEALGQTDMGRDLLEQDYILKQITASLIYPEKKLGKTFWDRVDAKAQAQYGTTQIPVNTFNKVWIMADSAEVFEHNQTAFVVGSHLKVMLEEDYLALRKHEGIQSIPGNANGAHSIGSQIVREIVLPELEKEVNAGKNFANLRQIVNSLILANWYKRNLKEALLNQVYTNQSKVKGINLNDPMIKRQIYEQYLKAYKKGVFNYIKDDINAANGQAVPRKYFSGGIVEGPNFRNFAKVIDAHRLVPVLGAATLMMFNAAFNSRPAAVNPTVPSINSALERQIGTAIKQTTTMDRAGNRISFNFGSQPFKAAMARINPSAQSLGNLSDREIAAIQERLNSEGIAGVTISQDDVVSIKQDAAMKVQQVLGSGYMAAGVGMLASVVSSSTMDKVDTVYSLIVAALAIWGGDLLFKTDDSTFGTARNEQGLSNALEDIINGFSENSIESDTGAPTATENERVRHIVFTNGASLHISYDASAETTTFLFTYGDVTRKLDIVGDSRHQEFSGIKQILIEILKTDAATNEKEVSMMTFMRRLFYGDSNKDARAIGSLIKFFNYGTAIPARDVAILKGHQLIDEENRFPNLVKQIAIELKDLVAAPVGNAAMITMTPVGQDKEDTQRRIERAVDMLKGMRNEGKGEFVYTPREIDIARQYMEGGETNPQELLLALVRIFVGNPDVSMDSLVRRATFTELKEVEAQSFLDAMWMMAAGDQNLTDEEYKQRLADYINEKRMPWDKQILRNRWETLRRIAIFQKIGEGFTKSRFLKRFFTRIQVFNAALSSFPIGKNEDIQLPEIDMSDLVNWWEGEEEVFRAFTEEARLKGWLAWKKIPAAGKPQVIGALYLILTRDDQAATKIREYLSGSEPRHPGDDPQLLWAEDVMNGYYYVPADLLKAEEAANDYFRKSGHPRGNITMEDTLPATFSHWQEEIKNEIAMEGYSVKSAILRKRMASLKSLMDAAMSANTERILSQLPEIDGTANSIVERFNEYLEILRKEHGDPETGALYEKTYRLLLYLVYQDISILSDESKLSAADGDGDFLNGEELSPDFMNDIFSVWSDFPGILNAIPKLEPEFKEASDALKVVLNITVDNAQIVRQIAEGWAALKDRLPRRRAPKTQTDAVMNTNMMTSNEIWTIEIGSTQVFLQVLRAVDKGPAFRKIGRQYYAKGLTYSLRKTGTGLVLFEGTRSIGAIDKERDKEYEDRYLKISATGEGGQVRVESHSMIEVEGALKLTKVNQAMIAAFTTRNLTMNGENITLNQLSEALLDWQGLNKKRGLVISLDGETFNKIDAFSQDPKGKIEAIMGDLKKYFGEKAELIRVDFKFLYLGGSPQMSISTRDQERPFLESNKLWSSLAKSLVGNSTRTMDVTYNGKIILSGASLQGSADKTSEIRRVLINSVGGGFKGFKSKAYTYAIVTKGSIFTVHFTSDDAMAADKAAVAVKAKDIDGGIDLNTSNGTRWKDRKEGPGVEMNIDPAMIERIRREGVDSLSESILRITPITNVWPLAGVQAPAT